MITRAGDERLSQEEIKKTIQEWEGSPERNRLINYKRYYESENTFLSGKVRDREQRGKTPNYFIPTAYYSTLVDTMAGYLFQNIQYIPEKEGDSAELMKVLKDNKAEIKDMSDGTHALTYNRAVEYVYTMGEKDSIKYKFTPVPTEDVILIYTEDIEPTLWCAIRLYTTNTAEVAKAADVIYKDEVTTYHIMKDQGKLTMIGEPKGLLFDEVPMVVYNTEVITKFSSFNCIMPYINALDWLVTGNTNDLDRLVDSLLVLGKKVDPDDLMHSDEWKTLENYKTGDRAEYLSKEMSPEFRKYVSELLIQEIHKHSHIIDWYSPDTGMGGAVSGKALQTRLFDMNMFSQRIEKVYRIGLEKRLRLLSKLLGKAEKTQGEIEIKFNRITPSDFEEKVKALNEASFLTEETKVKELGMDWEIELERQEAALLRGPKEVIPLDGDIE